jgi:hypothetical protein
MSETEESMQGQFMVKTLQGKSICMSLDSSMTVRDVKNSLSETEGVPVDQQRLVFGGKQLEDGSKLGDYNIKDGSTIQLVLKLKGGF